MLIFNNGTCGL